MNIRQHKVSVIVPTFNASTTIERCLESISYQDYPNVDIIVVDDASTDDTLKRASSFNVTIISNQKNYGVAQARNRGVEHTDSDIVVFIDSDVAIPVDAISRTLKRFEENTNIIAVGGVYSDNTKPYNFITDFLNLDLAYRGSVNPPLVKYLGSSFLAIRKETFVHVGGFSTAFHHATAEDIEFGYRVSKGNNVMLSDSTIQIDHLKIYTIALMLKTIFRRIFTMVKIIKQTKGSYKAGEHAPLSSKLNIIFPALILLACILGILLDNVWLCVLFIVLFLVNNRGFLKYVAKRRGSIFVFKSFFTLLFMFVVVDFALLIALLTTIVEPVQNKTGLSQ